jgi:hypothetical protein
VHNSTIAAVRSPLDRLIRAVGRGNYAEASDAYRICYDIGRPLVSQIVEKIGAVDWKDLGPHGRLAYFTCLMRLLHDIDESASRELADAILSRGCHPVVAAKLRSVQAFTLNDFDARMQDSLPIYIAKTISSREAVSRCLAIWLGHIPPDDLQGIHRLYVINRDRLPGFGGTYLTVLSVITLVWRPSYRWNQFAVLQTEFTLYHEVGHHVDRRKSELTESSEAFADTYAERIFRRVHPWLGKRWIRVFIMPAHTLRKLSRVRRLTPGPREKRCHTNP